MSSFDARHYWETRLRETYDLHGVGWAGMGRAFNRWMYRVRRTVFLREAARLPGSLREEDVLDIGSGTGFYVDLWHEAGARTVTGSDLTETAVAALAARRPADTFHRLDISTDGPLPDATFDVVSAFDILFHIVDDERFARALRNIHALTKPGGHFVFSDNFLHGATERLEHQVSRSLADTTAAVEAAGFEVVRRVPMFVLLNTPVDSSSRALRAWWKGLSILAARGEAAGWVAGAVAYPLELGALRRVQEGPSTELMVCRRPLEPPVR